MLSSQMRCHLSRRAPRALFSSQIPTTTEVTGRLPYRFNSIPVDEKIAPALSLATANKKEKLNYNINVAIDKFKRHKLDTGSTPVQSNK